MDNVEGIIRNRKVVLCPTSRDRPVSEILQKCPECKDFLLRCCACNNQMLRLPRSRRSVKHCHHFRIIYTDGACPNNGRSTAKAGIGAAYGDDEGSQLSKPVTDIVDNFPLRSNQRAELCAARLGLELIAEAHRGESDSETIAWIIATDSEYVVKGMTEWLPRWKVCSHEYDQNFCRQS
jgi:ribonuclease HI